MTFNILNIFAGQPYARWLISLKNIALASVRPRERTQYVFWQQSLQQVLPLKSLLWSSENTKNELWWLNWDAVTACAGLVGLGLRGNYLFFLVQLFCPICSNLDTGYLKVILIPGIKTCVLSVSWVVGCWGGSCHFGGWWSHVCKMSVTQTNFCLSLVNSIAAPLFGLWSVARVYFPGWELATFCWCLACASLLFIHVIVQQEIPISLLSSRVEQSPGEQTPRSCSTVVSAHTHHSPSCAQSVCVFLLRRARV